MSGFNEHNAGLFYQEYHKLLVLYKTVKTSILIAEEMSDTYTLAPINELRNSFDHIFRCIESDAEKIVSEFDSASRHIKRAGYDACEIIVTSIIEEINDEVKKYSTSALTSVFSEYYDVIKPDLEDCRTKYLIQARQRKNHDVNDDNKENYFEEFNKLTELVYGYKKEVFRKVPALEDYHQRKVKENIRNIIIGFVIAVSATLFASYILKDKNTDKAIPDTKTSIEAPTISSSPK